MNKNEINEFQKSKLDKLLIELYCKYMRIDINCNFDNKFQDYDNKETIAMWLTKQNKLIPRQWINYDIKNKDGKTLKDIMIEYHMPVPQEYQNISKMNIFDQAYFGIIPEINNHQPDEQNDQGYTVAMLLAYNNINIPEQWCHKPELQNNYSETVAMIQALQGKIPDKYWQHKANLQQIDCQTVAMRLAYNSLIPPQQWIHNPNIQTKNQNYTVAMYISKYQKRVPSNEWYHNPQLKNKNYHTVEDYLIFNNLDVPQDWKTNPRKIFFDNDPNIIYEFCDYYNIKINYDISPTYNLNYDGYTVAMWLLDHLLDVPNQWNHDPNLTNAYGQTVAMMYAQNCINPSSEWYHDPNKQQGNGRTVAMCLACNRIIPEQQWYHDPTLKDILDKKTTAMFIADYCKCIPDEHWNHNPNIQDYKSQTLAMILAKNGIICPKQWYHNPDLQDNNGDTVAMIYAKQQILAPKQLINSLNLKNKNNETLIQLLNKYKYLKYNNQYIQNIIIENQQNQCQICFQNDKMDFIKTKCGHQICKNCYNNLSYQEALQCPICRIKDWIYTDAQKIIDNLL